MAQADSQTGNLTELSVIVPIYNEEESIKPLCERLLSVLDEMGKPFEVIFVNDGSSDNSFSLLQDAAKERIELKIVNFRRNYGQTAATMAGIDHASGEVIIPIDADLQNDPADIPKLLGKLAEGYDVVSGWRKDRQDAAIRRNFVSRLANRLISKISGVHLHDYGCTLKAYKKDVVKGIRLYGEMHRFIPIYATWMGAKVCEIPVQHHARQFGQSKYGLERIAKVLLDLMVVKFLDRHMVKPIYVFGGIGLVSFFASFLSTIWMLWLKFFENTSMIQTPLPLVVTMTFLVGVMCILLGLLAEMIVRTYFESQGRSPYLVKETVNMEQE
ncbi:MULTISPECIES: glycosyltransferase family 2 protein [Thalassospira]|uniref:glycosyltransferase family 2 protein n=1 Tax=Thalassospira TaxID=168934 RepID=UPI0007A56FF5|nr:MULTISPECIES: glycosyltransferase family 2 protein [unclassified Thalassospira]KZD00155.1 glycosyl transferase [Thalassospira sp. MCCC 1A02898]BDW87938.1 glycosyl transferase [Thalassospira tepidiphila]